MATKSKSISYGLLWKLIAFFVFLAALAEFADIYVYRWRFISSTAMQKSLAGVAETMVVLMLAATVYLMAVNGRRSRKGPVRLYAADRLFADVHTLLMLAAVYYLQLLLHLEYRHTPYGIAVLCVIFLIVFDYLLSMSRQAKNGSLLHNTFCALLIRRWKAFLLRCGRKRLWYTVTTAVLILLYSLIANYFLRMGTSLYKPPRLFRSQDTIMQAVGIFMLIAVTALMCRLIARWLKSFFRVVGSMREMAGGHLNAQLGGRASSTLIAMLENELEGVQSGLKNAVGEAMRSEKMKTELITNVTHDLKTPLTSIINYVDLLGKVEDNPPKTREYAAILEEKSHRLKLLIENLIEASKASSGNVEVNLERLDLNELVRQTLGGVRRAF